MIGFDLVSLDVFGTLLDLHNLQSAFWKALDPNLPQEAVREYRATCDTIVYAQFEQLSRHNGSFRTSLAIFEDVFRELFRKLGLGYNATAAAALYRDSHVVAPLYDDTTPFLNSAGQKYSLCLSCDGDNEMVVRPRGLHAFKHIFTSEDLKTYKLFGDGAFFEKVVERANMPGHRIIHIGDTPIEMVGARKAGLATCWLNRTGKDWDYPNGPDYEVHSLLEAGQLLGTEA